MPIYQHRDGEMRIFSGQTTGAKASMPYYIQVLFVDAGLNAPIKRQEVSETLVMDRGVYSADAEYRKGLDTEKLDPIPFGFSCTLDDDVTTQYLVRMVTGTSPCVVNGKTLRSTKGESKISGISTPQFSDTGKQAWDIEVFWDQAGTDLGFRWREVWFNDVSITEGEDGVMLNVNGLVYGDVTKIATMTTGTTLAA